MFMHTYTYTGSAPYRRASPVSRGRKMALGGTQAGSYQTGSYQQGRFVPPKPKLVYLCCLIRPRLYVSEALRIRLLI